MHIFKRMEKGSGGEKGEKRWKGGEGRGGEGMRSRQCCVRQGREKNGQSMRMLLPCTCDLLAEPPIINTWGIGKLALRDASAAAEAKNHMARGNLPGASCGVASAVFQTLFCSKSTPCGSFPKRSAGADVH